LECVVSRSEHVGSRRQRTFRDIILTLTAARAEAWLPHRSDVKSEVGAGTQSCDFGALGPEQWKAAYVEPYAAPHGWPLRDNPKKVAAVATNFKCLKPSDENRIYIGRRWRLSVPNPRSDVVHRGRTGESQPLGDWGPVGRSGSMDRDQASLLLSASGAASNCTGRFSGRVTYGLGPYCHVYAKT